MSHIYYNAQCDVWPEGGRFKGPAALFVARDDPNPDERRRTLLHNGAGRHHIIVFDLCFFICSLVFFLLLLSIPYTLYIYMYNILFYLYVYNIYTHVHFTLIRDASVHVYI